MEYISSHFQFIRCESTCDPLHLYEMSVIGIGLYPTCIDGGLISTSPPLVVTFISLAGTSIC